MCDVERLESIEAKLDTILENQMKLFAILDGVLVEADYLTKVIGLNKNTISKNKKLEKFNRIGGRKILLKLESVPVLKSMRKPRTRPRSK